MPKGPRGEKRSTDMIGAAIEVARIVTQEIEEDIDPRSAATELGSEAARRAPNR